MLTEFDMASSETVVAADLVEALRAPGPAPATGSAVVATKIEGPHASAPDIGKTAVVATKIEGPRESAPAIETATPAKKFCRFCGEPRSRAPNQGRFCEGCGRELDLDSD